MCVFVCGRGNVNNTIYQMLTESLILDKLQYKGNTLCTSTYMSVGTLEIQMEVVLGVILLELNGGSMIQALLVLYFYVFLKI